ncbi:MAG: excinuclease ABC subunit UvrB [Spirochaetaceae bacterium]|jgi:excinuclease ABC subunit B|nr:excinuclease ABC subunit UvrB [Spirochaetaceae bacterium]
MHAFKVESPYEPAGDQGQAIEKLTDGINRGLKYQVLHGVTGSGKTHTMARVIENVQKPTLIVSHNKTLAAQLYREFKDFFPHNAVEYFVSYYNYYQPEAYVPSRDLYIEKDASINEEIERMRLSATTSLMERRDVIIVSTVSCIYGLGDPRSYAEMSLTIQVGEKLDLDIIRKQLIAMQYDRNDVTPGPGQFRLRGDVMEVYPPHLKGSAVRIETQWDEVESIQEIDPLNGTPRESWAEISFFPAKHFVMAEDRMKEPLVYIREELKDQLEYLESRGKIVEAQRLKSRTEYDLEMMEEMGSCPGIENYSRHLTQRKKGERPNVLIDYFPDDFLTMIDESHVTLPQIGAMYEGDRSRKMNLVNFGFRLPSAMDNRPLTAEEFHQVMKQIIFVTATPGDRELNMSEQLVEQLIRPTGLLDPQISVRPTEGQMEDLYKEIQLRIKENERVLVTTLTKKMAEELTDYLNNLAIRTRYIHSEVETIERVELLKDLRLGEYDVLVGINLLREGIDLPEVSLIAILDADKIGFLRSERSLIQIIGRTARNVNGMVIMYASSNSIAMDQAIEVTENRRIMQMEYNTKHGITPQTIKKEIHDIILRKKKEKEQAQKFSLSIMKERTNLLDPKQKNKFIKALEKEMLEKAKNMEFEEAAILRDEIAELKGESNER